MQAENSHLRASRRRICFEALLRASCPNGNLEALDGQHGLVILRARAHAELHKGLEERIDGVRFTKVLRQVVRTELGALDILSFRYAVGEKENTVSGIEPQRDAVKGHKAEQADGRVAVGDGFNQAVGAHNEGRDVSAVDKLQLLSV